MLRIVMTHRPALERVQLILRAGTLTHQPARGHRLESWVWQLSARQETARVLKELQPFLIVKSREAALALAFLTAERDGSAEIGIIYEAIRAMKTKGHQYLSGWPASERCSTLSP